MTPSLREDERQKLIDKLVRDYPEEAWRIRELEERLRQRRAGGGG